MLDKFFLDYGALRQAAASIESKKEEINTIWNTIKFFYVDDLKSKWDDPIGKRFIDLILGS